jgi:uncharacterized protein YdeI (YjbR/CyaY-like superfamily)
MPDIHGNETNLTRAIQPMPDDIREHLDQRGLMKAYRERPAYQQNDYLGWIGRAKRPDTRKKRIDLMLDELERGGVYMRMDHPTSRGDRAGTAQ